MPKLKELAELVGGTVFGDPDLRISGVSRIEDQKPGTITFLSSPKYRKFTRQSTAALVTADQDLLKSRNGIVVSNPLYAMSKIMTRFTPTVEKQVGFHPAAIVSDRVNLGQGITVGPYAVIEAGATVGDGAEIGPYSYIGQETRIGAGTVLHGRVFIYHHCEIGDRCLIQSGTVIGSDGYGFVTVDDVHHKIPQNGKVLVGHDVEIGANCTIDRGTIGDTTIGDGCKFDNGVHIAHNVEIGPGCLITAHVTIAGSVKIGAYCVFGGQAGVADHITIGTRAMFAAKTGVTKSLPGGKIYAGMPAREIHETNKRDAVYLEVQSLKKRLLKIEQKLKS